MYVRDDISLCSGEEEQVKDYVNKSFEEVLVTESNAIEMEQCMDGESVYRTIDMTQDIQP